MKLVVFFTEFQLAGFKFKDFLSTLPKKNKGHVNLMLCALNEMEPIFTQFLVLFIHINQICTSLLLL